MFHAKQLLVLSAICSLGLIVSACSGGNNDDAAINGNENQLPIGGGDNVTGPSPGSNLTPVVGDSPIGKVYVDVENKLTLYIASFEPETVACDAACEATWPPLLTTLTTQTAGSTGQFGIFAREDSTHQWTVNGLLLYTYTGDGASGEASGDGIDNQFYVARPIPVSTASGPSGEEASVALGTTLAPAVAGRLDKDGFTLYNFANDTAGASNCNDGCATAWPPLLADTGARAYERYSLVERIDGYIQWAYDEKPLYFYDGDNAAGEFNGDGVGGVWSIATQ